MPTVSPGGFEPRPKCWWTSQGGQGRVSCISMKFHAIGDSIPANTSLKQEGLQLAEASFRENSCPYPHVAPTPCKIGCPKDQRTTHSNEQISRPQQTNDTNLAGKTEEREREGSKRQMARCWTQQPVSKMYLPQIERIVGSVGVSHLRIVLHDQKVLRICSSAH
jgi:hypothetical protein